MHATASRPFLSVGEIADLLSVQSWRVARLFELGILPEPERIARRRVVPKEMIPQIVDALRARGWLSTASETSTSQVK
jgi:hypothetical protein